MIHKNTLQINLLKLTIGYVIISLNYYKMDFRNSLIIKIMRNLQTSPQKKIFEVDFPRNIFIWTVFDDKLKLGDRILRIGSY